MIAKQIKGIDFCNVLKYNQNKVDKGEAIILDSNLASSSVIKQTKELNVVRQLKPNLSKAVYHVSLNLPYEDANKLSDEKFANLARDYLEGMGFKDSQYVIYKHFDRYHSHIHIVANRVKYSGDVVSDSNDYKRSEAIIRKLEQKYNLTEFVRKEQSNVLSKGEIEKCLRTGDVPERLELQNILLEILNQDLLMKDFIVKLKLKDVNVKINQSLTTGFISGISFEYKGIFYKGSKIHKNFSWNNIKTKIITDEQNRDHSIIPEVNAGNRTTKKESNGFNGSSSEFSSKERPKPNDTRQEINTTVKSVNNKPRFRFKS
ncbi:Probable mobilization protein BmgA [Flavobacterium indicum GPTSA100-9 = DSM 17447]|uniref:Probable mobilization protein BmgA n=1 Tax=Flavobacterium indicum (strain DSM 17447 / CIP 109464 / GPTSA100-9) TaxID=1094466 RepID=H8XSU5_FLAIG|nr:relaxase/mobilization nuclease domain-containing protein [Flavobacterium indicum]CCG53487.1 Probable mobilization protein BmgA [Flavobacterium indicum GPTSA100-9 = DSM 17447]